MDCDEEHKCYDVFDSEYDFYLNANVKVDDCTLSQVEECAALMKSFDAKPSFVRIPCNEELRSTIEQFQNENPTLNILCHSQSLHTACLSNMSFISYMTTEALIFHDGSQSKEEY